VCFDIAEAKEGESLAMGVGDRVAGGAALPRVLSPEVRSIVLPNAQPAHTHPHQAGIWRVDPWKDPRKPCVMRPTFELDSGAVDK
jgi:hypothetical protein